MTLRTSIAAAAVILVALSAALSCSAPQPDGAPFPRATRAPQGEDALAAANGGEPPRRVRRRAEPAATAVAERPRLAGDERHRFEFRDTSIADALRLIVIDRAGLNFVLPPQLQGTVTASLPAATLDQALVVVLDAGDLDFFERDGIYSVRPVVRDALTTRVFQPSSADAAAIEPQLAALLAEGGGRYAINAQANVVHVTAPPATLDRVVELMHALDLAPREVLIEARILEVTLDETFERGVSLSATDDSGSTAASLLTDFLQQDTSFTASLIGSDAAATLRALQDFGKVRVIANPRVLALNQEEAKIEIIERVPYVESTATTTADANGLGTSTVQQVEFEEVGIRLHVRPVLGEDDEVTLKIMQEVSEVVDFFQGVPVTDRRLVDTRFVVRDSDTIVIGGLLKERTREVEEGVPWLMDIPFVGWAFSGTTIERDKVELLVFITPRIVELGEVMDVSAEYKRELQRKTAEYRNEYVEYLDDVPAGD